MRSLVATTIRYGKPNWTVSEGNPPKGLRSWMTDNHNKCNHEEKVMVIKQIL